MMMNIQESGGAYDDLMMRYACGGLDEALAVFVAAHAALDARARKTLSMYEHVGGALLEDSCEEAAMNARSLDLVLAQLECEKAKAACAEKRRACCPSTESYPLPLREYMERGVGRWLPVYPGVAFMPLRAGARRALIAKAKPGSRLPFIHSFTLVLQGALTVNGESYAPGSVIVLPVGARCKMRADEEKGCVCLSVTEEPARMRGMIMTALRF